MKFTKLLYINPPAKLKALDPIEDEYTDLMRKAMENSIDGVLLEEGFSVGNGWRGVHTTDCGVRSTNKDYLLKGNMVTNSLAVFYLQYYRQAIDKHNWGLLDKLKEYYTSMP